MTKIYPTIEWHTEKRSVASLTDYAKNPRQFTEKGMADLKASIKKLGYIDPIAINTDGTIIGGHARKHTLIELGLTEIDVRVPNRELTEKEIDEAIIRLNKNTAGVWDFDKLANEFHVDDLKLWGFAPEELGVLPAQDGLTDPDAIPDLDEAPATQPGDIWLLGDHRIMCGDSTKADDVAKLLDGAKPHLMVTDPPYGVEYDASWRIGHDKNIGKKIGGNFTKSRALGKVTHDDRADWAEAWALFPGDVAYVWHGGLMSGMVGESLIKTGFTLRTQIIWVKQHFVFGRGDYHWQHEPCWYAVKGKGHYAGDRKQTTVWQINNNNPFGNGGNAETKVGHSTQKPIECMKRPIENNSKPGDSVYEPFSGSGTTIIAGEMTGRKVLAMEISAQYVSMAVLRWMRFTGKEGILESTGETFTQVQERLAQVRSGAL